MWPFSYSRCAIDIVCLAEKPSLREASCCSVVVRNGAYGERRYGLRSTLDTAKAVFSRRCARAAAASASRCKTPVAVESVVLSSPTEVKSRPWATRRPSTVTRLAVKLVGSSVFLPWSFVANSASRSE